jgi:glucoamylase
MDVIVELYKESTDDKTSKQYEQLLWDYARFSRQNQQQSGCSPYVPNYCEAYGGPGEPKYEVNGQVYKGPWGRYQNDGPALRASTLIRFAIAYLAKGGELAKVRELYDSKYPSQAVIKIDLEYVAHHWYIIYPTSV